MLLTSFLLYKGEDKGGEVCTEFWQLQAASNGCGTIWEVQLLSRRGGIGAGMLSAG